MTHHGFMSMSPAAGSWVARILALILLAVIVYVVAYFSLPIVERAYRLQREAGTRYAAFAEKVDKVADRVRFWFAKFFVLYLDRPVEVSHGLDVAVGESPAELPPAPAGSFRPVFRGFDVEPTQPGPDSPLTTAPDWDEPDEEPEPAAGNWPVPVVETVPVTPVDALLYRDLRCQYSDVEITDALPTGEELARLVEQHTVEKVG